MRTTPSTSDFDLTQAYHVWLGISPEEQPPDQYRLIGVSRFENHPEVIQNALDRQMAHVRSFQTGKHSQLSQQILNQIAAAGVCLLKPERKAEYDRALSGTVGFSPPTPRADLVIPTVPVSPPLVADWNLSESFDAPLSVSIAHLAKAPSPPRKGSYIPFALIAGGLATVAMLVFFWPQPEPVAVESPHRPPHFRPNADDAPAITRTNPRANDKPFTGSSQPSPHGAAQRANPSSARSPAATAGPHSTGNLGGFADRSTGIRPAPPHGRPGFDAEQLPAEEDTTSSVASNLPNEATAPTKPVESTDGGEQPKNPPTAKFATLIDAGLLQFNSSNVLSEFRKLPAVVVLYHSENVPSALAACDPYARFHGPMVSFYENRKPQTYARYEDGKRDGVLVAWNENGRTTFAGQYRDGYRWGNFCLYEGGEPVLVTEYERDELQGVHVVERGEVIRSFSHRQLALSDRSAAEHLKTFDSTEELLLSREKSLREQIKERNLEEKRERAAALSVEKRAAMQARVNRRAADREALFGAIRSWTGN